MASATTTAPTEGAQWTLFSDEAAHHPISNDEAQAGAATNEASVPSIEPARDKQVAKERREPPSKKKKAVPAERLPPDERDYALQREAEENLEAFIDHIITTYIASEDGYHVRELRTFGASAIDAANFFGSSFRLGHHLHLKIWVGESPHVTATGYFSVLFTLETEEFGERLRRLYNIPDPVSAEEKARIIRERVEEAREKLRVETVGAVNRILNSNFIKTEARAKEKDGKKRAASTSSSAFSFATPDTPAPVEISALLFTNDLTDAADERRAAEAVYAVIVKRYPLARASQAMCAAGSIVDHARSAWDSALVRAGFKERKPLTMRVTRKGAQGAEQQQES